MQRTVLTSRRRLFGLAALLAAIAAVVLITRSGDVEDVAGGDPGAAVPAETLTVRYQDSYQQRRLFTGRIEPAQVADLGFQLPGEVIAVLRDVGDKVEAGDALARLDPVRTELRRDEAAAQLSEAKALYKRAETQALRIQNLLGEGYATTKELEDAVAERDAASEKVRLLQRSLKRLAEDARDTVLKAPFAGFVVARYQDEGATVGAGEPVLRLNQQSALTATIGVPTRLAAGLVAGQTMMLSASGEKVRGRIEGVGNDVDPRTRSRAVRVQLLDDPGLVPGGLLRLELAENKDANGAWVPLTALQESYNGLWSVYVVDVDDRLAREDVEIISLSDDRAYVRGTLNDGDRIVSSSTFRFVPGQRVRPVDGEASLATRGSSSAAYRR